MLKNVLILGSTGSIGESTLDVLERNKDAFCVWGITANTGSRGIIKQIQKYSPKYAAISHPDSAKEVSAFVDAHQLSTQVLSGAESLSDLACHEEVQIVMAAIVGAAGLEPTLAAVNSGKRVLLANKEALVCAGGLFMQAVKDSGAVLMPVDSEHNAIFQCLPLDSNPSKHISKVLLTGSGGPFRGCPLSELEAVTPDQACTHPNWSMGRKISVDSATMMNKGLEFIEACWLFDLQPDQIEILLHPQSVIHSMVHYRDGSVIAQMGNPDMRTPIAHALSWPERIDSGVDCVDFTALNLNFESPDLSVYPCLAIALDAAKQMGAAPVILNAANEIAVDSFLQEKIGFLDIAKIVARTLEKLHFGEPQSIEEVLGIDAEARRVSGELIGQLA